MGIGQALKKIAPTPQQAVDALAAIATINWVDESTSGNDRISNRIKSADLGIAWEIAASNANNFLAGGSKQEELIMLITQVGVVKVVIGLVEMVVKALKEGF